MSKLNQDGMPRLLDGIENVEQWNEKINAIRKVWFDYIGELPARVPVSYEVVSEIQEEDHVRKHIIYNTVYEDKVTAYLLIPNALFQKPKHSPVPAIMALHPTGPFGKDRVAIPPKDQNRKYGIELVSRGYVVLAPDALTSGERIYEGCQHFDSSKFYEQHPTWSTVGKNLIDHMQGVDLLCSLEFVDSSRIGTIGHSFGGYNSYFLAGVDRRIKAVVSSCGFSPFTGDPAPQHWGYRKFPYTHLPKISADLEKNQVPFEFHEIAALTASIPFFNYSAQSDWIFPHWKAVGDGMHELHKLYEWLGYEDRFRSYIGAGTHDFPPEIRVIAYGFLDKWLKV